MHRSTLYGVNPAAPIDLLPQVDIDRGSRLVRAAAPVLDQLAAELEGESFGLLLVDERTRIVERRVGNQAVARTLDQISATPGSVYSEDVVGTNALGTANELGTCIAVIGEDHFNESLKEFCCFGAPIRSLVTGRVQGVLDICGHVTKKESLFPPYILGAVRQIEQRLSEDTSAGSVQLLAEYRAALTRSRTPVVALNDEVTLSSRSAQSMLTATEMAILEDARLRMTVRSARWPMVLASGANVNVHAQMVPGGGVLFQLVLADSPGGRSRRAAVEDPKVVIISGEPGSGRTAKALEIIGPIETTIIDGLAVSEEDPGKWWARTRPSLNTLGTALLLDNVENLPEQPARRLAGWLRHNPERRAVMTVLANAPLSAEQVTLTSMASKEVVTPALRERRQDIPRIAKELLAESGFAGMSIAPSAMRMLIAQDWQGNLVEFGNVLRTAAMSRPLGEIRTADLPTRYRAAKAGLSRMEQIERGAIVDALNRSAGHRERAAEYLGVSRRTIFNRMRALHITEDEIVT